MIAGHRVVDVACGSGDAQTLAVTDAGLVFSWGDGDYGKLGEWAIGNELYVCQQTITEKWKFRLGYYVKTEVPASTQNFDK